MKLPDPRYERKFQVPRLSLDEIRHIVELHPFNFHVAYPARYINSVYLDTPSFTDYRAHETGAAIRRKYRVRWYGERCGRVERPILEVKSRDGNVGQKLLCNLEPLTFEGDLTYDQIQVAEGAVLAPEHRARLACSVPISMTRYLRWYYLSASGQFRLTIDVDLSYHAVGSRLTYIPAYRERGLSIVEVKYDVPHDLEVQAMTRWFPFRLGKYSKYIRSVERLRGEHV